MLEPLGLDSLSEDVYRIMLVHPGDGVDHIANRLGVPTAQVRTCLDHLAKLTVIRPYPQGVSGFFPVSPERAMTLLLQRHQADLAAHHQRIEAARAAAAQLIAECAHLAPGNAPGEEVIPAEGIHSFLMELGEQAHSEVMTFAPGGAHSAVDLAAGRAANQTILDKGVRMRTIYLDSIKHDACTRSHLTWLTEQGASVRTIPTLPIRMIIADRQIAVLPTTINDARQGALIVRRDSILTALCGLFEAMWTAATPFGQPTRGSVEELSRQHTQTLELLAQGMTDEAIAKRMGLSARTIRRTVADLLDKLQARSRFEAGKRAVQLGLLPIDHD
ncbi:regulatory LuxR family protein [Streptomyces sp. Ag109_O5-1]|uniref:helix-turn-helix transcriptional regulator n=1 Tax=Streptomyces sp. Ag109_O5-1 TaxID=1938851 RepID=UPI000F51086E|nr:LuxR C-terminal-related transcriptional regulator [Streptomyces sp. Ag109_O5-1]RPE39184.1 regulatory LuxR family protein [Streptomyces sp. Ag109_O5-1]